MHYEDLVEKQLVIDEDICFVRGRRIKLGNCSILFRERTFETQDVLFGDF